MLGKLGLFFLRQACFDYTVTVGRVVSFHGCEPPFMGGFFQAAQAAKGGSLCAGFRQYLSCGKRGFCQSSGDISPSNTYNTTQSKIDCDLRKFFYFPFARHNTSDFSKCQKWAQKNRKPFLDFLSWCAVLYVRRLFNF